MLFRGTIALTLLSCLLLSNTLSAAEFPSSFKLPEGWAPYYLQSNTVCHGLEACWGKLFPAVKQALGDNGAVIEKVIQQYERSAKNRIFSLRESEGQNWSAVSYESALSQSYLHDCEELTQAVQSKGPIDLIVVGQPFNEKGGVANSGLFDKAAQTYYAQEVKKRCGGFQVGSADFTECKKNVVVISQPGRDRLYGFLSMLKPGSISSFTYVGHGLRDQIVLGPRKLARYDQPGEVSREKWVQEENGALYVDELADGQPFANALKRAFRSDGTISLYACTTGQGFAGAFAHAAGIPSANASLVGMNAEIIDGNGKVIAKPGTFGDKRIENLRSGEHLVLVPAKTGGFRSIAAAPYQKTFSEDLRDNMSRDGSLVDKMKPEKIDGLARTIVTRITSGSSSVAQVRNFDGSISVVTFSEDERRRLDALMRSKGPDFIKTATQKQLFELMSSIGNEATRDKIQRVMDTTINTDSYGLIPTSITPVL